LIAGTPAAAPGTGASAACRIRRAATPLNPAIPQTPANRLYFRRFLRLNPRRLSPRMTGFFHI
jgi:hypothetical protein